MSTPRIIAFTKDWHDVPTCTTHILREMGRTLPVLWVNSIGTRKPSLTSGRDLGRMVTRLKRLFSRAEWKENQLRVLSPLLMPKAESRIMRWLNRKLFAWYVRRERDWMGDGPIEYWCFVPNAVDLVKLGARSSELGARSSELGEQSTKHEAQSTKRSVGGLENEERRTKNPRDAEAANAASGKHDARRATLVYYCVDDWSEFEHLDTAWIAGKERSLLQRADVVFATSRYLVDQCAKSANAPVQYMPHGVDYAKFARAVDARSGGHGAGSSELGARSGESRLRRTMPGQAEVPASSDYAGASRAPRSENPRDAEAANAASGQRDAEAANAASRQRDAEAANAAFGKHETQTASATIGFYGNLCSWIDFARVSELATARPDWRFVLIGPLNADVAALAALPNVDFPGRVEHDDLPDWCARFDAAIIPYDIHHPRMKSVNPVKARELLAAGVPIVASRLPDLEGMEPDVLLADTRDDWLTALERQSRRIDRADISARMVDQTWIAKVAEMRTILANRAL